MADTKVADIVANNLFFPFVQEDSAVKSAINNSSAIVDDPSLLVGLSAGGPTFNYRSFTNITNDTTNDYVVSTDDPTSTGTANKVTSEKQTVHRMDRNAIFSVTDLSAHFAGVNPMGSIIGALGTYRGKQRQKVVMSMLKGVAAELADGVNVASQTLAGIDADSQFNPDAFIDSLAPWDDEQPEGLILMVHGDIYRLMQKLNLIDFQPTNVQDVGFGTYLGATLVVDSTCPKVDGTTDAAAYNYTSYVMRPGAMARGIGTPLNPAEFEREARQADGGGVEYLVVRDTMAYHVTGMTFVGAVAGETPTNAEFEDAADWTAVWERKNIGMSYVITNA